MLLEVVSIPLSLLLLLLRLTVLVCSVVAAAELVELIHELLSPYAYPL